MMPSSRSASSTTGRPDTRYLPQSASSSARVASGPTVTGSVIIPDSDRLTSSTWCAWSSIDRFRCSTPTPPWRAIAMARQGGVGVLHRNLSIDDQAHQVDLVKRSESGMITDPVTVGPDATLAELDALCGKYRVSGLPVVDDADRLLGIITNRDLRFVAASDYPTLLVREVMTAQPLVAGPVGIS